MMQCISNCHVFLLCLLEMQRRRVAAADALTFILMWTFSFHLYNVSTLPWPWLSFSFDFYSVSGRKKDTSMLFCNILYKTVEIWCTVSWIIVLQNHVNVFLSPV